eukprot:8647679-Ditylum_brightwellii.AAC.1
MAWATSCRTLSNNPWWTQWPLLKLPALVWEANAMRILVLSSWMVTSQKRGSTPQTVHDLNTNKG